MFDLTTVHARPQYWKEADSLRKLCFETQLWSMRHVVGRDGSEIILIGSDSLHQDRCICVTSELIYPSAHWMMILIVPWIKDPFHTWNRSMVPQRTLGSVMLDHFWCRECLQTLTV